MDGLRTPQHDELPDEPVEPLWRARLRWRLAGATMWPAFAALTVLEAVSLHLLPVAGDSTGLVPAFLLCGFLNLALVAVAAPLGGRLWRRLRPGLPADVAADRAGTMLLLALGMTLLAVGIAHHGTVLEREQAFAAQSEAVRRYVADRAPHEYQVNVDRADTVRQGADLFRTCVPGGDERKHLCLIVTTARRPPAITPDADQRPNSVVFGADNPGRLGG